MGFVYSYSAYLGFYFILHFNSICDTTCTFKLYCGIYLVKWKCRQIISKLHHLHCSWFHLVLDLRVDFWRESSNYGDKLRPQAQTHFGQWYTKVLDQAKLFKITHLRKHPEMLWPYRPQIINSPWWLLLKKLTTTILLDAGWLWKHWCCKLIWLKRGNTPWTACTDHNYKGRLTNNQVKNLQILRIRSQESTCKENIIQRNSDVIHARKNIILHRLQCVQDQLTFEC